MANFAIPNSTGIVTAPSSMQNLSGTYKTLIYTANSSATTTTVGAGMYRRGKWYDMMIGTNTAPADNYLEFDVIRATIATTPAGATGNLISSVSSLVALDFADNNGFLAAATINSTAEVGVTAVSELWYLGLNQRASYRWVCAPGSELLYPAQSSATAGNGLAMRARSGSYTGTATATLLFQEQ
jgi:hypothetical protein